MQSFIALIELQLRQTKFTLPKECWICTFLLIFTTGGPNKMQCRFCHGYLAQYSLLLHGVICIPLRNNQLITVPF